MGKYLLVGWLGGLDVWFARQRGGYYITNKELDALLREVQQCAMPVVIDRALSAVEVLKVVGACAFLGVSVINENGEVVKPSPVVDGKVRYITREELGPIIPDGWMIECQVDTYTACYGEQLSFPARRKLELAIADIRLFLAKAIQENSEALADSLAEGPDLEQAVMDLGLVSSDSRVSGAAEAFRRT